MCPHIWLICPHIWLIQILSESAPIFGLFAPIFGLFANSRNSAPIFGLFGSKFAASLFWPDGTTWYRRISTYLDNYVLSILPFCGGESPKIAHNSIESLRGRETEEQQKRGSDRRRRRSLAKPAEEVESWKRQNRQPGCGTVVYDVCARRGRRVPQKEMDIHL